MYYLKNEKNSSSILISDAIKIKNLFVETRSIQR